MCCQECERLTKEFAEAGASFDAARERLQADSGISPKDRYQSLRQAALELQERLHSTRRALERHLQEHERGKANPASTNF